jgi:hypothetical protein
LVTEVSFLIHAPEFLLGRQACGRVFFPVIGAVGRIALATSAAPANHVERAIHLL